MRGRASVKDAWRISLGAGSVWAGALGMILIFVGFESVHVLGGGQAFGWPVADALLQLRACCWSCVAVRAGACCVVASGACVPLNGVQSRCMKRFNRAQPCFCGEPPEI